MGFMNDFLICFDRKNFLDIFVLFLQYFAKKGRKNGNY